MEKLREVFDQIKEVYFSNLDNDRKYRKVSVLWDQYYKLCKEEGIYLEEVDDFRMLLESECYSIYQEPKLEKVDENAVKSAILHLEEVLSHNHDGLVDGISMQEANIILEYVVYEVRRIYGSLGVDVFHYSLNGYCELGQGLSLRCLENLGLNVTKNSARDFLNYYLNHCFGTVTFPILNSNVVENKVFLIDTTYRQFFTSVRCNEGMYFKNDELSHSPDPGYFMKDVEIAKKLMRDGYIELDEYVAKVYGEGFYLSSLDKKDVLVDRSVDYFHCIVNGTGDYKLDLDDLEGLEVEFPVRGYKRGGI